MGTHAWSSVGIEEFLSADSRPSFVIEHPQNGSRKLNVVYRNDAFLREFSFSKVHGQKRPPPEDAYQESNASSFLCETYLWTVTIIRDRWRIVSRNACNHHKSTPREYASPNDQFREDPDLFLWKRNYKIHDWTAINIPPGISSWSKSLRAIDWSRTPLGPIARWPPQLRVMANLVCMDPNPAVLWWGQT
ncbi:hypothetical protein MMC10_002088 [Thelotrema lepadinum]|nr:hypothetical protein [Thelotrema lepadinum]